MNNHNHSGKQTQQGSSSNVPSEIGNRSPLASSGSAVVAVPGGIPGASQSFPHNYGGRPPSINSLKHDGIPNAAPGSALQTFPPVTADNPSGADRQQIPHHELQRSIPSFASGISHGVTGNCIARPQPPTLNPQPQHQHQQQQQHEVPHLNSLVHNGPPSGVVAQATSWSVPNPLDAQATPGAHSPAPIPQQHRSQQQRQQQRLQHVHQQQQQQQQQQQRLQQQRVHEMNQAQQQRLQIQRQQQQQLAQAPAPQSGFRLIHQPQPQAGGSSSSPATPAKPKVVLSAEAKQALAKAIWSAIRSPTGNIDPQLLQVAVNAGLPEQAVRNAARVAREREMAKKAQRQQEVALQQQQQQQAQLQKQQHAMQQAHLQKQHLLLKHQQQQQQQQQQMLEQQMRRQREKLERQRRQQAEKEHQLKLAAAAAAEKQRQDDENKKRQQLIVQQKMHERANWKRTQAGVFRVMPKGRYMAVPFSVGAMVRSPNTQQILKPSSVSLLSVLPPSLIQQASMLQGKLLKQRKLATTTTTVKLVDPVQYKRVKMEPRKIARALDRQARKSRQSVAESFLKQYKELNKSISAHQSEFYKFHRQRRADSQRLAKAVRDTFDKEQKKKEKEEVSAERARLAALKANDMQAYMKLLEETRNERLKFLLEKTEKHFSEISNLLVERQRGEIGSSDTANTGQAPAAATSYYASAHTRTEEVRQPSILIGGDLKEYQLAGLSWMVSLYNNRLNGILADEMGLGKTIQAISLLAYLMEYKQNLGPFLVIVPLSTLSNWQNEFTKWCPAARTVCYKGTPVQRKDLYKDQVRAGHFNVLLTTYEYVIRDKKFLRRHVWQYAIVDEGHRMKNAASKFAVTLATYYTTQFRILLTGTPLQNQLGELWSLLQFLMPTVFNSVSTFDEWFSAPFAQFSGSNTSQDDQEQELLTNEERILIIHRLHELLRPFMLRRVKSEVLDQLPEKVEKVLRCDLSSWQKELYKQISKRAVSDSALMDPSAADASVPMRGLNNIVMQLRKVCNHPFLFTPDGYHINDNIIRCSGKLILLDEMLPKLKAAGHRVLLFTQMTSVMTILEDYFKYRGYISLRLDGSTPADEREKRMYRYNAPDSPCFIFLLSTRAGGLGLNLTTADTVIIFDSDWNPAMDLQAQDRAHRIGQRSDVSVFRLITNSPVEEKILTRATEKNNISQLVVESGKFNKESVESDNSLERKRLMEVLLTDFDTTNAQSKTASEKSSDQGEDDDEDVGSDDSGEEDLNELLSNNETDFQLYTAYDKQMETDGRSYLKLYTDETDVPNWILCPQQGGSRSIFASADTGPRKRMAQSYDDGLTEKQFMRMMDKQYLEEANARKKQKTARGAARRNTTAAASPEVPDREEEDDLDSTLVDADTSGMPLLTDWTYRKLISCSKTVVALKDPSTKRRLAEIFLDKPDPAAFPDYYEIIEKPVAINDILRKCRNHVYRSIPEFRDDWKLMFDNAKQFNGEDSWVVADAQALEKELERVLKKNGFVDDARPPISKATQETKKKTLRIRLSLKKKN